MLNKILRIILIASPLPLQAFAPIPDPIEGDPLTRGIHNTFIGRQVRVDVDNLVDRRSGKMSPITAGALSNTVFYIRKAVDGSSISNESPFFTAFDNDNRVIWGQYNPGGTSIFRAINIEAGYDQFSIDTQRQKFGSLFAKISYSRVVARQVLQCGIWPLRMENISIKRISETEAAFNAPGVDGVNYRGSISYDKRKNEITMKFDLPDRTVRTTVLEFDDSNVWIASTILDKHPNGSESNHSNLKVLDRSNNLPPSIAYDIYAHAIFPKVNTVVLHDSSVEAPTQFIFEDGSNRKIIVNDDTTYLVEQQRRRKEITLRIVFIVGTAIGIAFLLIRTRKNKKT